MIELVNRYEAVARNPDAMKLFMRESGAKHLGILNGEELADPFSTPKFGEMENGQFLAVEKNGELFVFPNPAFKADKATVIDQEKAFFVDVNHLKPGQAFHVVRPAVFKRVGSSFERIQRGQLRVY